MRDRKEKKNSGQCPGFFVPDAGGWGAGQSLTPVNACNTRVDIHHKL